MLFMEKLYTSFPTGSFIAKASMLPGCATSEGSVLVGSTACFPIEIAGKSDTETPELLLPLEKCHSY